MKAFAITLVLAGTLVVSTRAFSQSTGCPSDDPYLRASVRGIISDARTRSALGITSVDPTHLRVLTDATDATACATLRSRATATPDGTTSVTWSYYTADGFYFAAVRTNGAGGRGGVYVFDGSWNLRELVGS